MELLLGCGRRRIKDLHLPDKSEWNNLITCDFNSDVCPDVVHNLEEFPYPFADNTFDEIHCYEVLEHLGTQGDFKFFFKQFEEIHRILKPDGLFFCSVPSMKSVWAWGDPSHTRVIPSQQLVFLEQPRYEHVHTTNMTDFRYVYKADFRIVHLQDDENKLWFILKGIKNAIHEERAEKL